MLLDAVGLLVNVLTVDSTRIKLILVLTTIQQRLCVGEACDSLQTSLQLLQEERPKYLQSKCISQRLTKVAVHFAYVTYQET